MYYIGVRDGKKEKEGKIIISSFVFCTKIYLAILIEGVHKIWRLSLIGAEKSLTEKLIGDKTNGQIKGMVLF